MAQQASLELFIAKDACDVCVMHDLFKPCSQTCFLKRAQPVNNTGHVYSEVAVPKPSRCTIFWPVKQQATIITVTFVIVCMTS